MADHVDRILEQWRTERPDLDTSPLAVIGRVSSAARLIDVQLRRNFARHDLDGASFDVIATLYRSGPPWTLSPGELMRTAMVTSGAITQRLDKLEQRGLVTRSASDADGRSVRVALTARGRELVDEVFPGHLATQERLLAGLDAGQRQVLADALRDLLGSLTAAAGAPGATGPRS